MSTIFTLTLKQHITPSYLSIKKAQFLYRKQQFGGAFYTSVSPVFKKNRQLVIVLKSLVTWASEKKIKKLANILIFRVNKSI